MVTWNCTGFESELQQCLDARRPLSSLDVAEREIQCPHCRGMWEEFLLLEQALAVWSCGSAAADFSEAVTARVLLDSEMPLARPAAPEPASSTSTTTQSPPPRVARRRIRSSHRRGHPAIVAAAAIILLACLAPLLRQPANHVAGPGRPDQEIAKANPDQIRSDRREADLQVLLRDAGTAYSVLAREAHTAVADATRLVPTAFPQSGPSGDLTIPKTDPEWFDEWRRDLKPIGDDVHQALGFLFEAVSVEADPSI